MTFFRLRKNSYSESGCKTTSRCHVEEFDRIWPKANRPLRAEMGGKRTFDPLRTLHFHRTLHLACSSIDCVKF